MEKVNLFIQACEWLPSELFFFSGNVFSPLVYYSHLLPVILSLVVGGILFFGNRKRLPNKILFVTLVIFSLWSLFDLVLWATPNPGDTVFFWSLVNMLEPLVYASALYFMYAFVDGKIPPLKAQLIIGLLVLPTLIFGSTSLNIAGLNFTNCDREAVEGVLVYYNYIIEILFALWLVIFGAYRYRRAGGSDNKQILLCTVGLALFLFSFAFGNIIGSVSENWVLGQVGLFGLPIFAVFLSILVGRFQSFKTKVFTTELLVIILWVLIVSMLFVEELALIHVILVVTLIATIALGILLIRSVKREIDQKDKLTLLKTDLETANKNLTTIDATKDEFLSFATHQLRSPLTSVKWGLGALKENYDKETVDKLLATTDDLISTVNDLLDISKIEQGGLVMKMEEFDLHDFVGRIVEEFRMTAEQKGLRLAFTGDIVPSFVTADQTKLRQVFVNLVDNAIKYTKAGDIKVVFRRRATEAEISVWDTGPGIAAEELVSLFDKFLRGAAGKASQGGSGLGLYLAKKIVESHHGRISAKSPGLGKGSVFTVSLPLRA